MARSFHLPRPLTSPLAPGTARRGGGLRDVVVGGVIKQIGQNLRFLRHPARAKIRPTGLSVGFSFYSSAPPFSVRLIEQLRSNLEGMCYLGSTDQLDDINTRLDGAGLNKDGFGTVMLKLNYSLR